MIRLLRTRLRQGRPTLRERPDEVQLPVGFRGRPALSPEACRENCRACAEACPTQAMAAEPLSLDLGACVFCGLCQDSCPTGAIRLSNDHRLAVRHREDLSLTGQELSLARSLDKRARRLFGRSLKLRQVSAGGCNGCEAELVALGNVVFDLARFGVQFVASPRHADGIVVTGPVSANMEYALRETYAAVPSPKLVIAVGACAISGGPFRGSASSNDGIPSDIRVDLYVPGCPPHPLTVLDGLLRLLGRVESRAVSEDERPSSDSTATEARQSDAGVNRLAWSVARGGNGKHKSTST